MIDSDNAENDFEYARGIYHDLLLKGSEALEDMMQVARNTEHPRAFEVLATTMKTVADINGNLMDLHKKRKDFKKKDENNLLAPGPTTNNLFLGSTTDLQRLLLNQSEKDNNVIDINDYKNE